jgi:hypothetical protein
MLIKNGVSPNYQAYPSPTLGAANHRSSPWSPAGFLILYFPLACSLFSVFTEKVESKFNETTGKH